MIIDSHTHAWPRWPYQPPVPDDAHRGRVEQLLHEMDLNGIDQAVLVCAQIEHNPDNNAYIAEQVARFPGRLHQFADVDSVWSATHQQPGAAKRLLEMAQRHPIKGFTHYLGEHDDGAWLASPEGLGFFQVATERRLIASLSCYPHQQAMIRKVALAFPSLPILCHHLGWPKHGPRTPLENLKAVLASATCPNIHIKISGFAYASRFEWDYPYFDTLDLVRAIHEHFGPQRMCWGSDYPVSRFFMTYRQTLEVLRTHCIFFSEAEMSLILGITLRALLTERSEDLLRN